MQLAAFEATAASLAAHRVRYIVVGGLAVNAHGYLRFTKDIDLLIALASVNVRAAFAALADTGYGPSAPVTAEGFSDAETRRSWIQEKDAPVLHFYSERYGTTAVAVFIEEPFDFDTEHAEAMVGQIAPRLSVRFVSLLTLIEMKQAADRPTDRDDIKHLRWMLEETGPASRRADGTDWSAATWEGSRREQIRRSRQLTVRERLEALDEITELAEWLGSLPQQTQNKPS